VLLSRAVWHERFARQLEATGAGVEVTVPVWHRAQSDAIDAGELLEVEGAFVDAERAAQAWVIASTAVSRIDTTPAGRSRRLSWLLRATRCVAELQITASESARRSEVTTEYGEVIRSALELAVDLCDVHAADVVLEAVRRDRVGVMITDLARREDVSEAVRAAAERVMAANNAVAALDEDEAATPIADESTVDSDGDRTLMKRGLALSARREASLAEAHHILGVVSVLADGRSLPSVSAADVLTARVTTGLPTASLQLYPVDRTAPMGGAKTRLVRRLTWFSDRAEVNEYLDEVELDGELIGLDPESVTQWRGSAALGQAVLPDPLRHLLDHSRRDRPLRLLIIPTDLFDIAFDALLLDDGSRLVERAAVSVHASLITMLHGAKHGRPEKVSKAIAMFDVQTLVHTRNELAALRRNIPTVETIRGRTELVACLGPDRVSTVDAFALAVHGFDDANGWGQTKQLPDGSVFSAAEALALSYPSLCVLASCHSNVRVGADLELAGFPMALFARGALTVIGSLFAIDDHATGEIMQDFWYHLARGTDPVMALRLAKLDWLEAVNPAGSGQGRDLLAFDRGESARLWSGLVAMGGAHL
jgi:hypothetical protein